MAKQARRGRSKGGVNKAQAIRDEFNKQGIDAAAKDVIAALKARGITVAPAQVSNIRTALKGPATKKKSAKKKAAKKKAARRKTTRRKAATRRRSAKKAAAKKSPTRGDASVSVSALVAAKEFADKLGGIDQARQALDILSRLS